MNSEKYIGLDVHQATISAAVMDSQGKLVTESIFETKASLARLFTWKGLHPGRSQEPAAHARSCTRQPSQPEP